MSKRISTVVDGKFVGTIIVDTREQVPYQFANMIADAADGGERIAVLYERGTLKQGDYSLLGYETSVSVERKSLSDLFGTLGQGRDRFERELERLATYRFAMVVVEAEWRTVLDAWPREFVEIHDWATEQCRKGTDLAQHCHRWLQALTPLVCNDAHRHSGLNKKTIARSVIAWRQRFPNVHWEFAGTRGLAEAMTFRTLERFLRERLVEAAQSQE